VKWKFKVQISFGMPNENPKLLPPLSPASPSPSPTMTDTLSPTKLAVFFSTSLSSSSVQSRKDLEGGLGFSTCNFAVLRKVVLVESRELV
jgi:hypothetical protein